MADLVAHAVFFVVEPALLGAGDMAPVMGGVEALLTADTTIFRMEVVSLTASDLAIAAFVVDALILIGEAMIDLGPTRMMRLPAGFGRGAAGAGRKGRYAEGGEHKPGGTVHFQCSFSRRGSPSMCNLADCI
jgi:hypothetical protein